jgi:hypothetical protein
MHCCATDDSASHLKCPEGKKSWCFWQRAIAKGEKPEPSAKMIGTALDQEVAKKIYPVYLRLTETHLLERCLRGLTQNANESLHNCVWCKLPKIKFFARYRLDYGAAQAVLVFNQGLSAVTQQLDSLGWGLGRHTRRIQFKKDKERVEQGQYRVTTKAALRKRKREAGCAERDRRAGKKPALYGPGIAK